MYDCTCVKVSVWMPAELIKIVRAHTGAAKFDRYIVAAVAERLRLELLDELAAYLEAEFGPIPADVREQTIRTWPNYDEDPSDG